MQPQRLQSCWFGYTRNYRLQQQKQFNATGHRILEAAKQTIFILLKKSDNNWLFSIILSATMIWFYAAQGMSLQEVKVKWVCYLKVEGMQPVASSSSSNSSLLLLLLLVPLLPAIFQSDPLWGNAENDHCQSTLHFLWLLYNKGQLMLCLLSTLNIKALSGSRKCSVCICRNVTQHFSGNSVTEIQFVILQILQNFYQCPFCRLNRRPLVDDPWSKQSCYAHNQWNNHFALACHCFYGNCNVAKPLGSIK